MYCLEIRTRTLGVVRVGNYKDLKDARKERDNVLANGLTQDDDGDGPIVETTIPAMEIASATISEVEKD